ncbi:MFS transporter, DHA1 family, inner membrane transport protein [Actinokineospora alba]|uniref:MFS transporter, DHA1 family, inner membrane transport protein n=1 Tax=Actinokineospora alba TaxID=504798 RepID=A0A1H0LSE9_9PSEU|nr:MFS transporter [Actinokineospora alba]TDP67434.1 DHA1 family inner membrane transport protein [Actinokineospora alba]SDI96909.1 MFS transporter, DHA1 family, inner membrane transport protein [Actinokineospora alba]SDO71023.1 MFS transporter, DHA1 family, inner membrane transport protein [Actinokineospora alba]
MPLALLALAIGAFGIGTTEFVIMGVLPQVAAEFGVSIPTAGWLVTGYALGVVLGAPVLTVLGTKVSRKKMLMLLMGLFIIGNAISAAAPTFGAMLAGRVVAALAHGAFFGVGSVVAAGLVAPERKASAISLMFMGLTVANIVGVPLGTSIGQSAGWRVTFTLVALLGVVGLVGVAALVPEAGKPRGVTIRAEFAAFRSAQVWLAMAMTVLGYGGVFAAITYIAPMMTEVTGYSPGAVTWLLVLFGFGMFAGNLVGGRFADRALMPMLFTALGALALTLLLFTVTAHDKVLAAITLTLIGALGFATVPPLQKRVLDQAAAAPTLASAANIGAFNLGNALAAWLGGIVISAGLGYTAANWVGALLTGTALLLAFVAAYLDRRVKTSYRDTSPGESPSGTAPIPVNGGR